MPFYVYDNWSAYDEMSDDVPLTEALAMRQFDEVCRLRRLGVKLDAYLMDAFWYAKDAAYLGWRRDRWPRGPEAWIAACKREGIVPGLWFTANTLFHLDCPEGWSDSVAADGWGLSCAHGGFLEGFFGVLDHWYRRGVRVFKFDFADFGAAPLGSDRTNTAEVRRENIEAYRGALHQFRAGHPEVVLLAYNGFEHTEFMPWTDRPTRPVMDRAWLEVFDTVYCGDPRPSDVPLPNFWRTLDVYADAMIHMLHRGSGLKLAEIDNCAFMIGQCGTCYRRGSEDWRTTALLSYARGGRVHVTMGNLEALTDEDAKWLARVQRLYAEAREPAWVGGNPGNGELYAYAGKGMLTAINPSLQVRTLVAGAGYFLSYSDGLAQYEGETLTLGPGSVAMLSETPEFGRAPGIPLTLELLDVDWEPIEQGLIGQFSVPENADVHVVFQQQDISGRAVRTSGGSAPSGKSSAELLSVDVRQGVRILSLERPDDKTVWSGMSWAYGIVKAGEMASGVKLEVRFETCEPLAVRFKGSAFKAHPRSSDVQQNLTGAGTVPSASGFEK